MVDLPDTEIVFLVDDICSDKVEPKIPALDFNLAAYLQTSYLGTVPVAPGTKASIDDIKEAIIQKINQHGEGKQALLGKVQARLDGLARGIRLNQSNKYILSQFSQQLPQLLELSSPQQAPDTIANIRNDITNEKTKLGQLKQHASKSQKKTIKKLIKKLDTLEKQAKPKKEGHVNKYRKKFNEITNEEREKITTVAPTFREF